MFKMRLSTHDCFENNIPSTSNGDSDGLVVERHLVPSIIRTAHPLSPMHFHKRTILQIRWNRQNASVTLESNISCTQIWWLVYLVCGLFKVLALILRLIWRVIKCPQIMPRSLDRAGSPGSSYASNMPSATSLWLIKASGKTRTIAVLEWMQWKKSALK